MLADTQWVGIRDLAVGVSLALSSSWFPPRPFSGSLRPPLCHVHPAVAVWVPESRPLCFCCDSIKSVSWREKLWGARPHRTRSLFSVSSGWGCWKLSSLKWKCSVSVVAGCQKWRQCEETQSEHQTIETMDPSKMIISPGISCWERGKEAKGAFLPERDF